MKYESTILKRLIETYGVLGNPRYISEIIKEFIMRGKERFPNLFTYQADWLAHIDEFGLNPSYTVSYTGQSIYAPNTLERPVKRAILKGQTLVNVLDYSRWGEQEKITFVADGTAKGIELGMDLPIKTNTKYLTIIPVYENTINSCFAIGGWDYYEDQPRITAADGTGIIKIIKTTREAFTGKYFYLELWGENTSGQITFGKPMSIEYQEGMENWDIPYFEGMQSVQMSVLTTVGKNLLNIEDISTSSIDGNTVERIERGFKITTSTTSSGWGQNVVVDIDVKENTDYVYSVTKNVIIDTYPNGNVTWSTGFTFIRGIQSDDALIERRIDDNTRTSIKFNTNKNNRIRIIHCATTDLNPQAGEYDLIDFQLEEASSATAYEPYKTNTLSTPSDLELRGIGNVQDTLDCLTGEVIERIGEYQITGEEDWYFYPDERRLQILNPKFVPNIKCGAFACDKLQTKQENDYSLHFTDGTYYIGYTSDNWLRVILGEDLTSLEQGKEWLKANKPTIQYQLKTESIKTVDLTILDQNEQNVEQLMSFNGGTHFTTSSQEGSLLPTISIDVETDLEATLMMCSLEGNTL